MLIGVISDTHIPTRSYEIPQKVLNTFEDVDMILHAGDVEDPSVLDKLGEIAPTIAVSGNCDRIPELNKHEIIEVEDHKIGLIHGVVYPRGDTQQLYYIAKELDVDILVSGHTHQPMFEQIGDVLLINPGSPTQPRMCDPSVMLLKVNKNNDVEAEFVKVGRPVCSTLDISRFNHKKREE